MAAVDVSRYMGGKGTVSLSMGVDGSQWELGNIFVDGYFSQEL